ncbi:hypothetical protein N7454_010387 [Penicillium verhagenii]|nr:hypothetical protein N7454_010387 [Penicillium verhagenii]
MHKSTPRLNIYARSQRRLVDFQPALRGILAGMGPRQSPFSGITIGALSMSIEFKAALEFDLPRQMATFKDITVDTVLIMLSSPAHVAGLGAQGTLPSSRKREGWWRLMESCLGFGYLASSPWRLKTLSFPLGLDLGNFAATV